MNQGRHQPKYDKPELEQTIPVAGAEAVEEELHRILTARTVRRYQQNAAPDSAFEKIAQMAIKDPSPRDWLRRIQSDRDINEGFRYIAAEILRRAAGDVPA